MSLRTALTCVLLAAPVAARAQPSPEYAAYNGRDGSSGGLGIVDADSGAPGSLRFQLVLDSVPSGDFLRAGTEVGESRQALSVGWTVQPALELYAALRNRGVTIDDPSIPSPHALGEWLFGAKLFAKAVGPVHLGGDARFALRGNASGDAIDLGATSIGLRGAASVDLRDAPWSVPFIGRLNLDYLFDNGAVAIEDVEAARYAGLSDPRPASDEDAHLVSRLERYAFDVSRVDRLTLGLGVETPMELTERTHLHPMLEWSLALPVNRQGYDCPIALGAAGIGTRASDRDSCVAAEGPGAWPMRFTVGARFVPPVDGLSVLLAIDWALSGDDTFTHELAPAAPFVVVLGLGFNVDPRPEPTPLVTPVAAPPPPLGRVRGRVVAAGTGVAVAGASVRIADGETAAFLTEPDGHFMTHALAPGEYALELAHPDHEPARCVARVSDAGGDVDVRCELAARPKHADLELRVVDAFGVAVAGALVAMSGPAEATFTSDPDGRVARAAVTPGAYRVRVDAPGYLAHVRNVSVEPERATHITLVLLPRPSTPGVRVRGRRIVVPALRFEEEATTLAPEAKAAVAELADLLLRTPEITHVRASASGEEPLSLARAHAVRDALVAAGVAESRVEAVAGPGASGQVDIAILP